MTKKCFLHQLSGCSSCLCPFHNKIDCLQKSCLVYKQNNIDKKRKLNENVQPQMRKKVQIDQTTQPGTAVSNKYTPLQTDEEKSLPPPLFIYSSKGTDSLLTQGREILSSENIEDFNFKIINKSQIKLQLTNIAHFRAVQRILISQNINFRTFQISAERSLRVILRGLPIDFPKDDVLKFLTEGGFQPRNISNLQNFKTKTDMPLFQIDLDPTVMKNKDIFNIKSMFHMIVKFEVPRPSFIRRSVSDVNAMVIQKHTVILILDVLNVVLITIHRNAQKRQTLSQPVLYVKNRTRQTTKGVKFIKT